MERPPETALLLEHVGPVLVATINRPHKGNSINREVVGLLESLLDTLEGEAATGHATRALVMTGAGSAAFCAGVDIHDIANLDYGGAVAHMRRGQRLFDRLEELSIPVIAAIDGVALGGGLELALAADIRLASSAAGFAQPECLLGNVPGWGGTQRLPRAVGLSNAFDLICTGRRIGADEALGIGLVSRIETDVVGSAIAMAQDLSMRSFAAMRGAKRAIYTGIKFGYPAGIRAEANEVGICCETPEQHEAVDRFFEKRR